MTALSLKSLVLTGHFGTNNMWSTDTMCKRTKRGLILANVYILVFSLSFPCWCIFQAAPMTKISSAENVKIEQSLLWVAGIHPH